MTATITPTRERAITGRRPARHRQFTKNTPAGEVVLAYLDAKIARLAALDLAVRRDKPDAVHQMRVTVRRLRAVLQAYPGILREPDTRHLLAELKWLGEVLGAARDAEVLAGHLRSALAAVPTELVLGPAQARISVHFAPVEASARRELLEALDSERYHELRADLTRLLDSPPLTSEAAEPAGRVLGGGGGGGNLRAGCCRAPCGARRGGRTAACGGPGTRRPGGRETSRCTRRARRPSVPVTRRRSPGPRSARSAAGGQAGSRSG
jgi:hypothetical protein